MGLAKESVVAGQQQDPKALVQDANRDAPDAAPAPPAPVAPVAPGGVELTDDELDKVAGGAGMQHEISKSAIGNIRG
jgi:hypothetical protein